MIYEMFTWLREDCGRLPLGREKCSRDVGKIEQRRERRELPESVIPPAGEIFPSHKSLKNKMIIRKKVGHLRLVAVIC